MFPIIWRLQRLSFNRKGTVSKKDAMYTLVYEQLLIIGVLCQHRLKKKRKKKNIIVILLSNTYCWVSTLMGHYSVLLYFVSTALSVFNVNDQLCYLYWT